MSEIRSLILRFFLLSAISLSSLCLAKEPGIAVQFDPGVPNEKVSAIWLGYLIARVGYREEHKLPVPASGTIVPTFEEEVYARTTAAQVYLEMKEKDKDLHDSYWEILSQIKTRGFMNAYVWTYLRRDNWPNGQRPENVSAFESWSRSILKNHKAQTHGSLAVQ